MPPCFLTGVHRLAPVPGRVVARQDTRARSGTKRPERCNPRRYARRTQTPPRWLARGTHGRARSQQHYGLCRGTQPIEDGPFAGAEGFMTRVADEALLLLRMDPNIALAGLASGMTVLIGAECSRGVHDTPPWLCVETLPRVCLDPRLLYNCRTTVCCKATPNSGSSQKYRRTPSVGPAQTNPAATACRDQPSAKFCFDRTSQKKTMFTTSGTSMPVSSMSTEIAMWGALSACEKLSIRLCAYSVLKVMTRANSPL